MSPIAHPAPGTQRTVTAPDGARLAIFEHPATNGAAQGPTLVLAHGWTLTHESWLPVIERLQQTLPVRVVTYDQRGHGRSSAGAPRHPIHGLGEDLHRIIEALAPEGPLVLAGHSMGGMTIMAYAAEHDLPVNPLYFDGFLSIGCWPCTRAVKPGEDARAGRWAGKGKTECGLWQGENKL